MSDVVVHVHHDHALAPGLTEQAKAAAVATLKQECQSPAELTILFTDAARIRQMNRDFRGFDESTDVLSFPFMAPVEDAEGYLGDIAIALPVAEEQARRAGHPLTAEVALLTVHGVLHLLGYDHADRKGKADMWRAQRSVLERLGLGGTEPAA